MAASAAAASAGIALAAFAGSPLPAALVALCAGAAAAAFALPRNAPASVPEPEQAAAQDSSPLPDPAALIDGIDEPVLLVREGRVLLANQAARHLLGAHIEGVDVRLAIRHPAAAERLTGRARGAAPIELAGVGGQDRRWEMTTAWIDGDALLVRLSDRSEAHAAEQARTDFVANASHELRTPLATLLGFLETLQDKDAAEDTRTRTRFLAIMEGEARRMRQLVDDLISLSRIEAERFSPPREAVDLLPLASEAASNLRALFEEKGSRAVIETETGETVVSGDRAQLLQLITNLLDNAAKYGRPGAPVTVRFAEGGGGMLSMRVADRGEGIAPEHLPHLTRRFYRVDAGRSRAAGGTGLGLAIVKHIAGRHMGRIGISSRPGEGTSVEVLLPRAPEPLSSKSHESVTGSSRIEGSDGAKLDPEQ